MAEKKKILEKLEKQVTEQEKEKEELENYEKFTGKKVDVEKAPGVDVSEEMQKRWEHQDTARDLAEDEQVANEGIGIEEEEDAGQEPNPEIERAMKVDADEDTEEE